MTKLINLNPHADGDRLKTARDYYLCMSKFITVNIDGEEVLYLFDFVEHHSRRLWNVQLEYPDAVLVSAGFCEYVREDAEDDPDCIPLIATGHSTSIKDSPRARSEDTRIIKKYFNDLKNNK